MGEDFEKATHDKINDSDEEGYSVMMSFVKRQKKNIEEIEDILVCIVDIFGTIFKTHKELTLEMVSKLLQEMLHKYLNETSFFETKMGVFIYR